MRAYLLNRSWNLREHANSVVQVNIAQEIADLRNYQQRFRDVLHWLDRADSLMETTPVDEPERTRRKITSLYYLSIMCYKQQNYKQAEGSLREMIKCSQKINWQRATIYAQNLLADTGIELDRLDEAEGLLQTGLPVSEHNKDKRRTAHFNRSYAYLRQRQGNIEEARYYAERALDGFERLGMQLEAKEMLELLEQF